VVTRRRLALAGLVAAAAVATVLVLSLRGGPSAPPPLYAISGETHLSRSATLFADTMRASVVALVDNKRIDPARVGFKTDFRPFVVIGVPQVRRHDAGRLTRLVFSTELICLTNICLSHDKPEPIRVSFPATQIFYTARSGGPRKTLRVGWIAQTIAPRTTVQDLNGADPFLQPSWRATTDPAPVSYSLSPRTLETVLFVAAGVLLALGLGALAQFVRTGKLRLRPLHPLERAVVRVERAPDQGPERRKALELLGRELSRSGEPELALLARELAWAEPSPLPTLTQPLTVDVRRVIERRSNGHSEVAS
jgi:hypothetical protein